MNIFLLTMRENCVWSVYPIKGAAGQLNTGYVRYFWVYFKLVKQSRLQNMEYTHWISLWSLPARMIPVGRTKYFIFSLRLYFTAKHAKKLRLPE